MEGIKFTISDAAEERIRTLGGNVFIDVEDGELVVYVGNDAMLPDAKDEPSPSSTVKKISAYMSDAYHHDYSEIYLVPVLYLDCEWNGPNGELISMALVGEKDYFYEVLPCEHPVEWVKFNVMPVLDKDPISLPEFQERLKNFLQPYGEVTIFADWPTDILHLCNMLMIDPMKRFGPSRINFIVERDLFMAKSKIPHNALADATAMRDLFK